MGSSPLWQQPGYGPQPGYGQQGYYGQPPPPQQAFVNNTTVVTGAPTAPVIVTQQRIVQPSDCMVLSVLNLLCCNIILGAIAVAFSCMARDAFDRDCQDAFNEGERYPGVYSIRDPISQIEYNIFCEFDNEQGWSVIQRRMDGSTDFHRGWEEYVAGFGDSRRILVR
ncbi:hypothetical protein EB796_006020 [Bugula neritina]|uniref:Fibrinogen C-terminal domain-containing protein n=1 Tax=Bugula neritina TaxID=10212 RepID=A0A7J7KCK0_BUGNE|nr:hypothetical protein EB796_006020 [Bugula neritina]